MMTHCFTGLMLPAKVQLLRSLKVIGPITFKTLYRAGSHAGISISFLELF